MELKKMDFSEFTNKQGHYKMTKILKVIIDFKKSGMECAEVVLGENEYKSAASCCSTLKNSIKRLNEQKSIICASTGDRVFLYKKQAYDKFVDGGEEVCKSDTSC